MNRKSNADEALPKALYMEVGEADASELVSDSLFCERREEAAQAAQKHE